ncbi:ABC transporter substrate-binding protein [Arthrobacter sp. MPF02]|uniref:ABC transporter substrate-binding protein n=1 Tax=Arthrobacter sp. MPF02 TaxID=3388492 RepID=UPI00398495E7
MKLSSYQPIQGNISRRSVLAASGLLSLFAATGCVPQSASSGSSANGTLRMAWWGSAPRQAAYTDFLEGFSNANPDVTLKLEPAEYAAYLDRLATQAAAKKLPDVLWAPESQFATYAAQSTFLDLDTLDKGTIDYSQFDQGQVDSWRAMGGKQYSAVFNQINPVIQINKDEFTATGLSAPDDKSWEWKDLGALAKEYSKAKGDGYFGMRYEGANFLHLTQYIRQQGAELFDKEGKIGFDAGVVGDWFSMWEGWVKDGSSMPAELAGSVATPYPQVAGKIAIAFAQSNHFVENQAATKGELTMHLMPANKGAAAGYPFLWYSRVCIAANTPNPELAGRLVNYFINDPGVLSTAGVVSGPPSNPSLRKQALEEAQKAGKSEDIKVLEIMERDLAREMRPRAPYPNGSAGFGSLVSRTAENVTSGGVAIDQAVKDLITELQRSLDAAK